MAMSRKIKDWFKLTFSGIVLPIRGGPLVNMKWIAWCGKRFLKGTYEPCKTEAVLKMVGAGQTTFDIGGHVGYYAIIQAQQVGPEGHVFVFEPRPLNISYIKRHVRINKIENVTLIESAVSDLVGDSKFESRVGTGTGFLSSEGDLAVKTTTVDVLVQNENYPVPDFIKIDVEGGEIDVLNGATQTITERRPNLLVATHGDTEHAFVMKFLAELNYEYEILNENATKGDTEIRAWPVPRTPV